MGAVEAWIVVLAASGVAGVMTSLLLNLPPAPICTCGRFRTCRTSSRNRPSLRPALLEPIGG